MVQEALMQVAHRAPEQQLNEWFRVADDWANSRPKSTGPH